MKVKRQIADLRKQLDGQGEVVYLNTPYSADDASAQIEVEGRVGPVVAERDVADDQPAAVQPASRIGMIRYV